MGTQVDDKIVQLFLFLFCLCLRLAESNVKEYIEKNFEKKYKMFKKKKNYKKLKKKKKKKR